MSVSAPGRLRPPRSAAHATPRLSAPSPPGTEVPSPHRSGRVSRSDQSQRSQTLEFCSWHQHTARSGHKNIFSNQSPIIPIIHVLVLLALNMNCSLKTGLKVFR